MQRILKIGTNNKGDKILKIQTERTKKKSFAAWMKKINIILPYKIWERNEGNDGSAPTQSGTDDLFSDIGTCRSVHERRGRQFASVFGSLRLCQYGEAKYLIAVTHVFHLDIRDRILMLAYLQAGMEEGVDRIRLEFMAIEDSVREIMRRQMKNGKIRDLESLCAKMEADFVRKHEKLMKRVNKMWAKAGLPSLPQMYSFRDGLCNHQKIRVENKLNLVSVNREDLATISIDRIRQDEGKDGFALQSENVFGLFLFGESHGIVAVTNEHGEALEICETWKTLHQCQTAIPDVGAAFDGVQHRKTVSLALRYMPFCGEEDGNEAREEWIHFAYEAVCNGCKVELNTLFEEGILFLADCRTGVRMQIQPDDPAPGFESANVWRFASQIMQKEYDNILREYGMADERLRKCAINRDSLTDTQKLVLFRVDANNELDALRKCLESCVWNPNPHGVFDKGDRDEMMEEIRSNVIPEKVAYFEKLWRDYMETLSR